MGLGIPLVCGLIGQAGGEVRIANRNDQTGVCIDLLVPLLPETN
jgi:nitrogen fixation/metabolism regulation signal transduction histidine kinase